jgi:hypothetical protein
MKPLEIPDELREWAIHHNLKITVSLQPQDLLSVMETINELVAKVCVMERCLEVVSKDYIKRTMDRKINKKRK